MAKRYPSIIVVLSVFSCCSVMAQDKLYPNEFPLGDVTLLDGPFKKAMDLNSSNLFKYTVDRLLASYRSAAGLTPKASDYSGGAAWEGLNGHVGGHYLSALAMQYAATGDAKCKQLMDYMITEFKTCQDANGNNATFTGYLCGLPNGKTLWQSFKSGDFTAYNNAWVPWYNIHKTYAGLRDAWVYGGSETAKTMFLKLCDWGMGICSNLTDAQMQNMLGKEHGGINEMYADAYQMTGDAKYLNFAKRISHKWLLDAMAQSRDNLDNAHANTQVPKAVGFQRIGEVGNDNTYNTAANFFWTTVTTKRSIVIGGNSRNETFPAASACMDYINGREGVESCNTNNMLKLTEGLFRMKPDAKYADFFERALYNHILSTQNPAHGGYVYFTPEHPRHYRVYSAPDMCMWCCVGTGMENHTKYGQFIYTHSGDSLFINLFIASELNWKAKGVTLRQETAFPDEERAVFTVTAAAPAAFKMLIRHPYWSPRGEMKVIVGADTLGAESPAASYVEVDRTWKSGDVVTVLLPMHFAYEQLINVSSWVALKRGPVVLGAKTGTNDLVGLISANDRWGHSAGGTLMDVNSAPKLRLNTFNLDSYFKAVAGKAFTYKAPDIFQNKSDTNLVLEPFFRIHDARYMMYWNATVYTGAQDEKQRKTSPYFGITRTGTGVIRLSFEFEDPLRQVTLFTLTGKRIAGIPALSRTVTLDQRRQGILMKNGMYTVQVKSGRRIFTKKVYIRN